MKSESRRLSPRAATVSALALSLVVALLDRATGSELSFSIFYAGPVALAAWFGSGLIGILLALWSGLLWLAADLTGGSEYSHTLIPYWNALVRLAFFLIIPLLLSRLHGVMDLVRAQAFSDSLTGLPNSRRFRELLEAEFARVQRYGRPCTLAYLDLDNFKAVNDTKGHSEGDRALREVSRVLRQSVRATDWIARLGGDEFCVLLPETAETGALEGLRKLQAEVLNLAGKEGWPISVSLGAVTFFEVPTSLDDAIVQADHLMYRVKAGGKNAILQEVVGADRSLES